MHEKMLERVAALLAKAESTDSPHEAEALVAKAQQLATLHAVDLATARQRSARRQRREELTQRQIHIGPRGKPGNRHYIRLFLAIGHVNDLTCDIAGNNTHVIAFGYPSDIEVTETLYASLATQMVTAANAAIARGEHQEEAYWSPTAQAYRTDARVFRTSFYHAFVNTIARRLWEAREEALASTPSAPGAGEEVSTAGALVLRRKADEVRSFHAQASKARGTWRGDRIQATARSYAGEEAGRAAGRRARLSAEGALPGERDSLPA